MADRLLREQGNAFQQRMALIESKIRALGLRAWPGAVRSEQSLTSFTPDIYAGYSTILQLDVPSGRWICFANASIVTSAVDANPEQWIMSLFAFDKASGEALPADHFDNPSSFIWLPANTAGVNMFQSFSLTADLIAEEAASVQLAIAAYAGRVWTANEPRLRLFPV